MKKKLVVNNVTKNIRNEKIIFLNDVDGMRMHGQCTDSI